jgi:hypothetical protein
MELLLTLTKETSTSFSELLKLPFYITYGMYNTLVNLNKKEQEAQKKEEEAAKAEYNIPNINSLQSQALSSINSATPRVQIPNIPSSGSFHL